MAVLENLEPGLDLAMAYCNLSYLFMSVEDADGMHRWASKALALAERLGDLETQIYALVNIGSVEYMAGLPESTVTLERCLRRAADAGLYELAGRAYVALTWWAARSKAHDAAAGYLDDALEYCEEHGIDLWRAYLITARARSQLDGGHWDEAIETASSILRDSRTSPVPRVVALAVVGLVRARRGDPECWPPLDEAWRLAEPTAELQRIELVSTARAEAAWLEGNDALVAAATEGPLHLARQRDASWIVGALEMWRRRAGLDEQPGSSLPPPYAAQARGEFTRAAQLWEQLNCPYEAALALADSDDEDAMRRGLAELIRLGAKPAAGITARRMRARGVRSLPRGPRRTTRGNPANLTDRELQVLALLNEGLRDAEIGSRLFLSERTVGHHVSAILRKLEVASRSQAAAAAVHQGILSTR